jgi:hypothetical protein
MDIPELQKLRPTVQAFTDSVRQNWNSLDDEDTHNRYHELYDLIQKASGDSNFTRYVQPLSYWAVGPEKRQRLWKEHANAILHSAAQLLAYMDTALGAEADVAHFTRIKILFLAANPTDTLRLRLDEESRAIDLALHQTEFGSRFEIKQHWAVRVTDIQSYLLRYKPAIVHFSGHGSASSEIILEDSSGSSRFISPRALSQLFSILKDNIRCVVLNACYSEQQALAIAEHIDCVIGMSKAIGDKAAISFAASFYQALGYGRDVKTAFDLGRVQIDLEGLNEQDTPKLLAMKISPSNISFVRSKW